MSPPEPTDHNPRRQRPAGTAEAEASSCSQCGAWGVLYVGFCRGCYDFRRRYATADCAGCGRDLPVKHDYCRACWLQAALQAADPPTVTAADLAGVEHHQLSFAGMNKMRGPRSGISRRGHLRATTPAEAPSGDPRPADGGQLQLHLPGPSRVFDVALHAEPDNPCLVRARRIAARLGEARGWHAKLAAELDRALVICCSGHADGVRFTHTELIGILHRYGLSIARAAEVLTGAGLYDDDRVVAFDGWLDGKLDPLAPGITADVSAWVEVLRHGSKRSRPRELHTVRVYLRSVHPVLLEWSTRYQHLRQVTITDVATAVQAATGYRRRQRVVALRSLLRHCKRAHTAFADPTTGVRASRDAEPVILPLTGEQIDDVTAAAHTPAARLAVALAAIHAPRPEAIRALTVDDVDLGNRRLTIAGVTRPLDDLTHHLVTEWLDYRRNRWPNTANPYLIINKQTASATRPVSENALTAPFRGKAATLEALRVDRQLDEALTHGPDPLHLAAVFGLDDTTAIRYADAARRLLTDTIEEDDPAGSPRTQGPNPPTTPEYP